MTADRLYHDPDLVQFYDVENQWADDFDFCRDLAADVSSILDLGCGTGLLAATFAEGGRRSVVGVDPAGAMLDVARKRPGGGHVEWIEDDARGVRLDRRFDLVVLTGHAFQVFLTRADRAAVLATIARHLEPDGRFVFDTRNPDALRWKDWGPERSRRRFDHPQLGPVRAWNDATHDAATGIVTYETHYEILSDGRTHASSAKIAFPTKAEIETLMDEAGLSVESWFGDWRRTPFSPAAADIIPLGTLR